ncbi:MAG: alpha-hydroxy-acid oxidizing protein [Treponemataceae bacterium]|nr:alpha-hydroxy-acid oxidizing protein [Treponemataceae bacterium]
MTIYSSDSDKITRDFFDSMLLETRYLDSTLPSTKLQLYGREFDTPIMTAALSHLGNTAKDGMLIYAEAAKKANAVHWIGMGEDKELEDIVATGAATIKIIKPHADNKEVFRKIEHAVKAGCFALGMDIDHSFNSRGGYDEVLGLNMKAKSTEELTEFVKASKIPFIVKGVLSTRDAEKCLKAGCKGLVLSHHHNMMGFSVPPLLMLKDILSAVSNEIPVFVDCGIESGYDAYKCLALGATGVSVGRHLMPLLKEGPDATAARIKELTEELAGIMARTGVADLGKMDESVIHRRDF